MQLDANQLKRILGSEASLALVGQPYTEIYHRKRRRKPPPLGD